MFNYRQLSSIVVSYSILFIFYVQVSATLAHFWSYKKRRGENDKILITPLILILRLFVTRKQHEITFSLYFSWFDECLWRNSIIIFIFNIITYCNHYEWFSFILKFISKSFRFCNPVFRCFSNFYQYKIAPYVYVFVYMYLYSAEYTVLGINKLHTVCDENERRTTRNWKYELIR